MSHSTIICLDLAKRSFALVSIDAEGQRVFTETLTRSQVLPFFKKHEPCTVALECCGGSHYWAVL